jgi:uncharacterized membrane protein YdbT with pleckstrin-like domain
MEAEVPLLVVQGHWLALALDVVAPTLLVAMLLTGAALVGHLNAETVVVVLALAVFSAAVLSPHWFATSLTLTPRSIVVRRGLIVRSSRFVALEALQHVSTEQPLLGSLLGCGTVELCLLSGAAERLCMVPDPELVRDHIFATRMGRTP